MLLPRFLVPALALVVTAFPAAAQVARVQPLPSPEGAQRYEITVAWSLSLRAVQDSTGATAFDEAFARAATGGVFDVAELVTLPRAVLPPVRIEAAEYDELVLPPAAGTDTLLAALSRPLVTLADVGLHRRRPVATLQARLLAYDAARRAVRRYRRLVVVVETGAAQTDDTRAATRLEASRTNPHLAVTRSVLADGQIFKLPVTEAGLYRIDRDVLSQLGLSPGSIEPNHLKIYGNGGRPLPALNGAPRPADLVENPVLVRGGGDGSFDAGDVLLFYAAGPRGWTYEVDENSGEGAWVHYVHPFSNENVYFLKIDATDGRRVADTPFPGASPTAIYTTVDGRYVVDLDEYMWAPEGEGEGTGLTWVSTTIEAGGVRRILEGVRPPGLTAGTVRYHARVAIAANPRARVFFESNGTELASVDAPIIGRGTEDPSAAPAEQRFTQTVGAGAALHLTMRLQEQINQPKAALDWLRVVYPQALTAADGYLRFATPGGATGTLEFVLAGFTQPPQVWDVTDPGTVRRLGVQSGSGGYRVQVTVTDPATPRELVAFVESSPLIRSVDAGAAAAVANQNLHGLDGYPDFVIVAPEPFLDAARDLAEHRRQEGLEVLVTRIDQIYNEFSGGVPDMRAVRDYFKFLYDRAPDEERLLRYALLFGDGHFDYRGLTGEQAELTNWIFPYQTEETFDPDHSYTSDDYFGLLDDAEGLWPYTRDFCAPSGYVCERVDIGIGRFPVQTVEEARLVVEKIKHYESEATYGSWRSNYVFVADDGKARSDENKDYDLHVQNIDAVASYVRAEHGDLNLRKIYTPSYNRVYLNGWRFPEAKAQIRATLEEGALLFNYSGHGGPAGLADEELFTREDAWSLDNYDHLTIFVTATCSFGRWDMNNEQSGAEALILNPNGGAVSLMTTVRLVYTSSSTTTLNTGLNLQLNRELFRREENGLPRRLGDALRLTKNTTVGLQGNNRKFNLLGDPTLRLGLPAYRAALTDVNGTAVDEAPAPLRALDRVTLRGEVRTPDGTPDPGFNGTVSLTVFDAERRVPLPYRRFMPTDYYVVQEDLIWRGEVTARDGRFEATFVVPKDISYSNQPGRVALYAAAPGAQAIGHSERVVVGGTSDRPPDDAEGPQIALFLNDTTFVSGGLTTREPELIVKLFDESGINTVGAGVGHEMLLVVNGAENDAVDLSSAFRSEPDSYQRGTVRWRLREQPLGLNTLSVRVWDVLNNSSTAELEYVVAEDEVLRVANVYNYPNPTTGPTRFVFEHNQPPGTPARVQVRVYTLSGRAVCTLDEERILSAGPVQIVWDGLDEDFDRLGTGIYLYKVRVEVEGLDGERQVSEHIEKLAVIR